MVPKTSELLPDPDTPVNTVKRRFGIWTLTSLRLFTRAPRTLIRSWLSALRSLIPGGSAVLEEPEHVAVRVGECRHQPAAADVVRSLFHDAASGGDLGQL